MTFKRDGRLHRLAYNWNPDWRSAKPARTSICTLFWLTVLAVLVLWPLLVVTRVFGWVVRIIGFLPALVLFGCRPAGPSWRGLDMLQANDSLLPFVQIKRWPKAFGYHLMPGVYLLLVGVIFTIGVVVWMLATNLIIGWFFGKWVFGTKYGPWVFSTVMLTLILLVFRAKTKDTEEYRLVMGFVKAKKERFCPIVEFK